MRIVGGKFAGRDLTSPSDRRVRPTAEHMRSALLDLLEPELADARILDLFAGTGALGIEAVSRGSKTVDFVEWRPSSLFALKANIGRFKLKDCTRVFKHDAIHFADAAIVFCLCAVLTLDNDGVESDILLRKRRARRAERDGRDGGSQKQ